MLEVEWHKCTKGNWYNIYKIDANHRNIKGFIGQYIVWSGSTEAERTILIVGYGDIKKSILQFRKDIAIKAFEHLGVFITWCDIPNSLKKNIHNYLVKTLNPKMTTNTEGGKEEPIELPVW